MELNYWLHRCTCGFYAGPFTHELLKKHNYISIGWSDFSQKDYLERLTANWDSFEKVFDEVWGEHPRNRYNLWRFLKMKSGDIVVVPMDGGYFRIYEIADDVVYNNMTIDPDIIVDWNGYKATKNEKGYFVNKDGNIIDMGFYRKVKPLFDNPMDIPRNGFAMSRLHSYLKFRLTNADINTIKEEVDDAISRFREKRPISIKNDFLEKSAAILLEQIQKMSHDQLTEQLVNWYMKELGGETEIPSKNASSYENGDVDVIAHFYRLNDLAIYIQVKHHTNTSDSEAVLQLERYIKANQDTLQDGQYQMWVISTCDHFSEAAIKRASELRINLIDGPIFAKMLVENGVYSLPF
jgi:hypothetical protein